jgi:hypothetical protein
MPRVLQTSDRELVDRVIGALGSGGVPHVVVEEEGEGAIQTWCIDVAVEDVSRAAERVDAEAQMVAEERSPRVCSRCGIGMTVKEQESDDDGGSPLYLEYVCRKCGASQLDCLQ